MTDICNFKCDRDSLEWVKYSEKSWISNLRGMNPEGLEIKGWFKGQFPENFGKIKGCWTLNDSKLSLISNTECISLLLGEI